MGANPMDWGLDPLAVELPDRRSAHGKVFQNPDGTLSAVLGRNLHYEAAPGVWEEVDATFQTAGAGFVLEGPALCSAVTVAGVSVVDRASGQGVRWLTPSAPTVSGCCATCCDQGLDWQWTVTRAGLKLEAAVSAPQGARTYTFPYELLGGAPPFALQADGSAASSFVVPRAVAIGADGEVYPAGAWRLESGALAVDFDDAALPAQAYPYRFDPTTTFPVTASGDDGTITSANSATYPPTVAGTPVYNGTTLTMRRSLFAGQYSVSVGLMRWNTSTLPAGVTITNAVLRVRCTGTGGGFTSDNFSLVAEWYSGAAWTSADWTATAPASPALSVPLTALTAGTSQDLSFSNVAGINQTGVTGLRLHISGGTPTGLNTATIASWDDTTLTEPQLIITYTLSLVTLAGALNGTGTTTATARVTRSVQATATAFGTATATLRVTNRLYAAAAAFASAGAAGPRMTKRLAASAAATGAAAGGALVTKRLQAPVTAIGTAAAGAQVTKPLASAVAATGAAAGGALVTKRLQAGGSAAGTAGAGARVTKPLQGAAAAAGTAAAAARLTKPLQAAAAAVAAATGNPAGFAVNLQGAGAAYGQVQATLFGTMGFALFSTDYIRSAPGSTYPPTVPPQITADRRVERSYSSGLNSFAVAVRLLRFDTSALPDGATVTGARLDLQGTNVKNNGDGRQVVGEYYAASNWPADAADWTATAPNAPVFAIAVASIPAFEAFTLPLADYSGVAVAGFTGLRLHISGGQPTAQNYVDDLRVVRLVVDFAMYQRMQGALTAQATATATAGVTKPLQAAGAAAAQATGKPAAQHPIQGALTALATAAGTAQARWRLAGTLAAAGTVTALLRKAAPLQAAGAAAASAAAPAIRLSKSLQAAAAATATGLAEAIGTASMQAVASGRADLTGLLGKLTPLAGTTLSTAALVGAVTDRKDSTGSLLAQAQGTAAVTIGSRMQAAAVAVATVSPLLSKTAPLAATAPGTGAAAATARVDVHLAGQAAGTATLSAVVRSISAQGSATATAAADGNVSLQVRFAGTAPATAAIQATATRTAALSGVMTGIAVLTGGTRLLAALAGQAAGVAAAAAIMRITAARGSATANAATAGQVVARFVLQGAAAGRAQGGALVAHAVRLTGSAQAVALVTGTETVKTGLAGSGVGRATIAGLPRTSPMRAAAQAGAATSGHLTRLVAIGGQLPAAAAVVVDLQREIAAVADVSSAATAAGAVAVRRPLAGALTAQANTGASLYGLAGAPIGRAQAAAGLTLHMGLAGALTIAAGVQAQPTRVAHLAGALAGTSPVSGGIVQVMHLAALATGASVGRADLIAGLIVVGIRPVQGEVVAGGATATGAIMLRIKGRGRAPVHEVCGDPYVPRHTICKKKVI